MISSDDKGVKDISSAKGYRVAIQSQLVYFPISICSLTRLVDPNLEALTFSFWDSHSSIPIPSTLSSWARSWTLVFALDNPQQKTSHQISFIVSHDLYLDDFLGIFFLKVFYIKDLNCRSILHNCLLHSIYYINGPTKYKFPEVF